MPEVRVFYSILSRPEDLEVLESEMPKTYGSEDQLIEASEKAGGNHLENEVGCIGYSPCFTTLRKASLSLPFLWPNDINTAHATSVASAELDIIDSVAEQIRRTQSSYTGYFLYSSCYLKF